MASLRPSFVFFTLTIALFLVSPVFSGSETQSLINRICKQVEDYNFCNKTFNNRITSPTTDIYGLTKITIQQTFGIANYVYTNILHLLNYTTDPSTKKALVKCRDGYNVVILQFELAALLFDKHEYEDAFDAEKETTLAQAQCKSKLLIPRYPKSRVIEGNKETRTLIAMSLASFDLLLRSSEASNNTTN